MQSQIGQRHQCQRIEFLCFPTWLVAAIGNHRFCNNVACVVLICTCQIQNNVHAHMCTCRFTCLHSLTDLRTDILTYLPTHSLHHLSCLFASLLTNLLTHSCIIHRLDLLIHSLLTLLTCMLADFALLTCMIYIYIYIYACFLASMMRRRPK